MPIVNGDHEEYDNYDNTITQAVGHSLRGWSAALLQCTGKS
jgi:hypothetical protein